jgi:phosphonoacetaldehyde dehydrogenase
VAGATKNSGQRCTAVKRILVQESVADRFVPLVLEARAALRRPLDPGTDVGTVITRRPARLFEARVEAEVAQGAKSCYHPATQGARCCPPIVVDHVPHDSELVMRRPSAR